MESEGNFKLVILSNHEFALTVMLAFFGTIGII